jgi:hypothetical protein
MDEENLVSETLRRDLLRWLREEDRPTDGVEVLAAVPLLSAGDAPEYAVVLWRDAHGAVDVWTAWQYRDLWSAEEALRVLEARADGYEAIARLSRAFVDRARAEGLPGRAREGWTCSACGTRFMDEQPVCPACGANDG